MAFNGSTLSGAVWEQIEAEATGWWASTDAAILDDEGVVGTIGLVLVAIPHGVRGLFLRFMSEKAENSSIGNPIARQSISVMLRGVADGIEEFMRLHGTSPETARTELVRRWKELKVAKPGIAFSKSPLPAAAPPDILRTIGAYPAESQDAIFALYGILRKEASVGVDIVPEVEGDAGVTIVGLFEAATKAGVETLDILNRTLPGARGPLKDYRDWQMRRTAAAQRANEDTIETNMIAHSRRLVRAMMPFIEAMILGFASRHPQPAVITKVQDFADKVNAFAGVNGSSIKQKIGEVGRIATSVADAGFKVFAGSVVYVFLLLAVGYFAPSLTLEFAGLSFAALVAATAIASATGRSVTVERTVRGRKTATVERSPDLIRRAATIVLSGVIGVLGVATAFFVAMLVDTEPFFNEAFPAYQVLFKLQPFCLTAAVMCLFFLLVWNQVVLGLLQKAGSGVGFLHRAIERLVGNETEAKALAKHIGDSTFVSGVGYSILSAVATLIFMAMALWLFGFTVVERGIVIAVAGALAILFANVWAGAVRKYPTLAKKHEEVTSKLADKATTGLFVFPVVMILGMVAIGLLGINRMQSITAHAGAYTSAIADKVDSATGVEVAAPATTTATRPGSASKCAKLSPASLKAMQAKGVCK